MVSKLVDSLISLGVEEVVFCPGGRSAAILNEILKEKNSDKKINIETLYDERSAGFYALGKSLKTNKPVVVLTTSGSAVAALYPALLEAKYQEGVQLIAVTADRPEEFAGTGTPQTINQKNIFIENGIKSVQFDKSMNIENVIYPLHINVPLEDPNPVKMKPGNAAYETLVLVSSLKFEEKDEVIRFLKNYSGVLVLESFSNLTDEDFPKAQIIKHSESFLVKLGLNSFKEVYRVGGVPLLKSWREAHKHSHIFFWDRYKFPGTLNAKSMSLKEIAKSILGVEKNEELQNSIEVYGDKIDSLLKEHDLSEVSQLLALSRSIPKNSNVFIGNSMPARDWEFVKWSVFQNHGQRGVNGIDGSLALALGSLNKEQENWIVLGDITSLYNINDFQVLKFLKEYKIRIVVMNNSGGRIFENIFKENKDYFINEQNLSFEKLADFWGLEYLENTFEGVIPNQCLIELKIAPSKSLQFWNAVDEVLL